MSLTGGSECPGRIRGTQLASDLGQETDTGEGFLELPALIGDPDRRYTAMGTLYLMGLEDRVDLARTRIDRVILRLRSVQEQHNRDAFEQVLNVATDELQDISELIGR
jgi:hypothetical protein